MTFVLYVHQKYYERGSICMALTQETSASNTNKQHTNKPEHNKNGLNSKDFESITGTVTLEQLKHCLFLN